MALLVAMAGICVAGVLFMLRFLAALCSECKPGRAVHLLSLAPVPSGGDERDRGEVSKLLSLADHHTVRRRRVVDSPAASTAASSSIGVASRARWRAMKGDSDQ